LPEDLDSSWQHVRAALREEVADFTYHLWLEPLQPAARHGELLLIRAPDHIRTWVEERYGSLIAHAARRVLGAGGVLIVPEHWSEEEEETHRSGSDDHGLNPKYTFEQFVIGEGNRLAHAAALAVAEQPSHAYNPLFIHGRPGLGKTHLLHAIGNYLHAHSETVSVRYAPVEVFTNLFVRAARGGEVEGFKARFRDVHVLLVDDVQFLANKAMTKEEFFHTFNALFEGGGQLVITNDRAPCEMGEFETRLVERFASGLVAALDPPEFAARVAILRKRAELDGLAGVGEDTLREVARRAPGSVRALEGALIRLMALTSLRGEEPTPQAARRFLGATADADSSEGCTIESIQDATAGAFGLTREALLRKDRTNRVARARQVAMYLARELTEESLPEIGRVFAGRNHSTVLHAHRRVAQALAHDDSMRRTVEELWARLAPEDGAAAASERINSFDTDAEHP
jgi:chromosomal replication initiator protein